MITIKTPQKKWEWLPSGNPIVYTIKTTNLHSKLSYIIDVNINYTDVVRLKYPVYDRNRMDINLHNVVNDYISDHFVNDCVLDSDLLPEFQKWEVCRICIKVTEEYYNGTTMVVDTAGAVTSDVNYIWRGVADFQDSRNLTDFIYKFKPGPHNNNAKFLGPKVDPLTYLPSVLLPGDNEAYPAFFKDAYEVSFTTHRTVGWMNLWNYDEAWGVYANPPTDYGNAVEIMTFDKDFNLIKTGFYWYYPINGMYYENDYDKMITQFQVGLSDLNPLLGTSLYLYYVAPGFSNFFTPDEDKYYTINIESAIYASGRGIRAIPFKVVDCNPYDVYNILYKTCEGSWWQIRTTKKHYNETEVKTSIKYNTWGLGAQEIMPNDKRFKQTMHTEANGTIKLNTDWIESQAIVQEIEEMIISPQIYLVTEDATPQYIPVILKDTTHKIKNKGQDKLFQYEFEFEEAYKKNTLL